MAKKIIFALTFFFISSIHCESEWLHCPLVWEPFNSGQTVPKSAVTANASPSLEYVTRFKSADDEQYYIGRLEETKTWAFAAVNETHTNSSRIFDILTNPFECQTKWSRMSDITSGKQVYVQLYCCTHSMVHLLGETTDVSFSIASLYNRCV